jgi:hypothetical protein
MKSLANIFTNLTQTLHLDDTAKPPKMYFLHYESHADIGPSKSELAKQAEINASFVSYER